MKINKNPKKLKSYMKCNSTKIMAGVITFAIIGLIIFAGPAKAFILELSTDKGSLTKGEEITFTATLDIESIDKYLPIKNLELDINGPTPKVCKFYVNGSAISGCDGMTISPITTPLDNEKGYGYGYGYDNSYGYGYEYDFGYGYGYGYGYGAGGLELHLVYEIILDTQYYLPGEYESQLKALIGNKTFESKDKPTFTIFTTNGVLGTSGGGGTNSKGLNLLNDFCGNGICDIEETTATCPEDCPKIEALGSSNDFLDINSGESDEEAKGLALRITGAVIGGVTSTTGIIAIIFIIALGGVFAVERTLRKRRLLK